MSFPGRYASYLFPPCTLCTPRASVERSLLSPPRPLPRSGTEPRSCSALDGECSREISGGYGREPSQSIAVRVEFTFERVEVSLAALLVRSLSLREGLDGVERGPEPVEGGAEVPRGGVRGGAPRGELRAMLARGVVRGGEGRRRGERRSGPDGGNAAGARAGGLSV